MTRVWLCWGGWLLVSIAAAHEPLDLFSDAPKLAAGFHRLGAWNLRHIHVEGGADAVLPGETFEEDSDLLVATFAKAIQDLGLDLLAVIEHQPHPGEPNRMEQLAAKLGQGWRWDETHIEYDEPYDRETNRFGGLQFGLLWNTQRGVEIDSTKDRLLDDLRQPRDEEGRLTERRTRVPWLIPVRLTGPKNRRLEFDLMVLHLKSGGGNPQAAEVTALERFIRDHQAAEPKRHLIVCGDWNIRPDQSIRGQGRPRLQQMLAPTENSTLMRLLTVGDIRPSLQDWERLDDLVGNLADYDPLKQLLPYSHLPDNHADSFTLLDHMAISRSLEGAFRHPVEARLANGGRDLVPGIQIVRPQMPLARYSRLTDHFPVVLTLQTP